MRDISPPVAVEKIRDDKQPRAFLEPGAQEIDCLAKEEQKRQIWNNPRKCVRPINLERRARFARFDA